MIKLLFLGLGIVLGIIWLCRQRWYKNWAGKVRGFGECPNCGDRWNWKEETAIHYEDVQVPVTERQVSESGRVQHVNPRTTSAPLHVSICKQCALHPESIDPTRIRASLADRQWPPERINQAVTAIAKTLEV